MLLKHIFPNLLCYSDTFDESLLPERQIFVHIHRPEIAQRKLLGRRVGAFAFPFVHLHSFSLGEKGHCNKAPRCARLTKAGTSCQKLQSVDKIWQKLAKVVKSWQKLAKSWQKLDKIGQTKVAKN